MHSILHKLEAVSEARHLVVLGYLDSEWSKIGLSKVEHDFVTSKLAIGVLSIHINQASMIFGTIKNKRDVTFSQSDILNRRDEYSYTTRDLTYDFGFQYLTNVGKKNLIFGATYCPEEIISIALGLNIIEEFMASILSV